MTGSDVRDTFWVSVVLYGAFAAAVGVANYLAGTTLQTVLNVRSISALILFFGLAICVVAFAVPLLLAARGRLSLPVWPPVSDLENAVGIGAVAFLFARAESISSLLTAPGNLKLWLASFVSQAAFNFGTAFATVGIILPALKKRLPIAPALALSAAAVVVVRGLAVNLTGEQFNYVNAGVVFVYAIGYGLYYLWSRSLFLMALLYHLVQVTGSTAAGVQSGLERFYFWLSPIIIACLVTFIVWRGRYYAAGRFAHF